MSYTRTKEHNINIGLALKGRVIDAEWRKKISEGKKGCTLTKEAIEQRTETRRQNGWNKGLFAHRGEKHWNWKGGIATKTLNRKCKERDGGTCQICGLVEPDIMEVDHIKSKARFPELKNDLNNLITLCPNCHRRKTNREEDLHPR